MSLDQIHETASTAGTSLSSPMPEYRVDIRPDQAHAAMRIGFLLHRIENESAEVWTMPLSETVDVNSTFQQLHDALLSLSHRIRGFEDRELSILRKQMTAWFTVAVKIRANCDSAKQQYRCNELRPRIEHNPEALLIQKLQNGCSVKLQTLLSNIVKDDSRLSTWFEIGERFGSTIVRLIRGTFPDPITIEDLTLFFSGINRLPQDLRRKVEVFLPDKYESATHLAAELLDAYNCICSVVLKLPPTALNLNYADFPKAHDIQVGGVITADVALKNAANSAPVEKIVYSTAILPPREWAIRFGHPKNRRGARQFLDDVKTGAIRVVRINTKKIRVAIDDLPPTHPESPRYKPPTTAK